MINICFMYTTFWMQSPLQVQKQHTDCQGSHFLVALWLCVKVKVIQLEPNCQIFSRSPVTLCEGQGNSTGTKLPNLVVSIMIPSLKDISLQQSECKPLLNVFRVYLLYTCMYVCMYINNIFSLAYWWGEILHEFQQTISAWQHTKFQPHWLRNV